MFDFNDTLPSLTDTLPSTLPLLSSDIKIDKVGTFYKSQKVCRRKSRVVKAIKTTTNRNALNSTLLPEKNMKKKGISSPVFSHDYIPKIEFMDNNIPPPFDL